MTPASKSTTPACKYGSLVPVEGGGGAMNRLEQLHDAGVSIWLDTLSRQLVDSGAFAALIAAYAVAGATSNPTIFAKAITGFDRRLRPLPLPRSPGRQ